MSLMTTTLRYRCDPSNNTNKECKEDEEVVEERIPKALQDVFLASNRGAIVDKPPPKNIAFKLFSMRSFAYRWTSKQSNNSDTKVKQDKNKKVQLNLPGGKRLSQQFVPSTIFLDVPTVDEEDDEAEKEQNQKPITNQGRRYSTGYNNGKTTLSRVPTKATGLKTAYGGVPRLPSRSSTSGSCSSSKPEPISRLSPQSYLNDLLHQRGYTMKSYKALECGYYPGPPSDYRVASNGPQLINIVNSKNNASNDSSIGDNTNTEIKNMFREILNTGISKNPCNEDGYTLLHMICRNSAIDLLRILVQEYKVSVSICDTYGRTPLHDACWLASSGTANFDIIDVLLQSDIHLLYITDCRNATPLSFIRMDDWDDWIDYIDSIKDTYWPDRRQYNDDTVDNANTTRMLEIIPPLTLVPPGTNKVQDWDDALSIRTIRMIASGKMNPSELQSSDKQNHSMNKNSTFNNSSSTANTENNSDYNDDDDDDEDDDDDNEFDPTEFMRMENEMKEIMESLGSIHNKPLKW